MKKILNLVLMLLASLIFADASASGCDPCTGAPWPSTGYLSFSFTIPYRPGCTYNVFVKYYSRTCAGQTEDSVDWNSTIFEQLDTSYSCNLSCPPDCPTLHQIVMNQIMLITGPMLQSDPSPCYYLGTIIVPPGAASCYGLTPGSRRHVMLPCDTNGCCFAQITPAGPNTYYETVLSSTSCPDSATIPDSNTISWSCDSMGRGGGGALTFRVPLTPDSPHVCEMTCSSGLMAPTQRSSHSIITVAPGVLSGLKLFPNPVGDELHISFDALVSGKTINAEIFDIAGRPMSSTAITTVTGQQDAQINTHNLAPGQYVCRITYQGGVVDTRFTK